MQKTFTLRDGSEYIELHKILKIFNLIETGGMAKEIIREGNITVNGEVELRPGKKLRSWDIVAVENVSITIA